MKSPSLDPQSLTVRQMADCDLIEILAIENNVHVSPWSRLSFEESLSKDYICRVIEDTTNKKIVAYLIVCSAVDELHILNLAAGSQWQGIGLGHMLMQAIVDIADDLSLRKIFLEVRVTNKVAQGLYLKWQFKQIAVRKRYYSAATSNKVGEQKNTNDREDALVFLCQLPA